MLEKTKTGLMERTLLSPAHRNVSESRYSAGWFGEPAKANVINLNCYAFIRICSPGNGLWPGDPQLGGSGDRTGRRRGPAQPQPPGGFDPGKDRQERQDRRR